MASVENNDNSSTKRKLEEDCVAAFIDSSDLIAMGIMNQSTTVAGQDVEAMDIDSNDDSFSFGFENIELDDDGGDENNTIVATMISVDDIIGSADTLSEDQIMAKYLVENNPPCSCGGYHCSTMKHNNSAWIEYYNRDKNDPPDLMSLVDDSNEVKKCKRVLSILNDFAKGDYHYPDDSEDKEKRDKKKKNSDPPPEAFDKSNVPDNVLVCGVKWGKNGRPHNSASDALFWIVVNHIDKFVSDTNSLDNTTYDPSAEVLDENGELYMGGIIDEDGEQVKGSKLNVIVHVSIQCNIHILRLICIC